MFEETSYVHYIIIMNVII